MDRNAYLSHKEVQEFVNWLSSRLGSGCFSHVWTCRRTGNRWSCNNLHDAFTKYEWSFRCRLPNGKEISGVSFRQSNDVLNVISTGLRKAVADEDNEGALQWCLSLMRWGGVFPHNGDWLINNMGNLSELLGDNRRLFLGENIDPENDINPGIRFNSGMTKVYSLLVDPTFRAF